MHFTSEDNIKVISDTWKWGKLITNGSTQIKILKAIKKISYGSLEIQIEIKMKIKYMNICR